ncbi:MAG: hypothetical protein AVDCRST_MAG50-975, partial [uncultured Acidimicrobiales bacterium]
EQPAGRGAGLPPRIDPGPRRRACGGRHRGRRLRGLASRLHRSRRRRAAPAGTPPGPSHGARRTPAVPGHHRRLTSSWSRQGGGGCLRSGPLGRRRRLRRLPVGRRAHGRGRGDRFDRAEQHRPHHPSSAPGVRGPDPRRHQAVRRGAEGGPDQPGGAGPTRLAAPPGRPAGGDALPGRSRGRRPRLRRRLLLPGHGAPQPRGRGGRHPGVRHRPGQGAGTPGASRARTGAIQGIGCRRGRARRL